MIQADKICAWVTIALTVVGLAAIAALIAFSTGFWMEEFGTFSTFRR